MFIRATSTTDTGRDKTLEFLESFTFTMDDITSIAADEQESIYLVHANCT